MSEVDGNSTNLNGSENIDPLLEETLNNDQYFLEVLSNEISAQIFFSLFLPLLILDQIDLSTLRTMHTRDVDPHGVETIGDIFFMVDMKDRPGLKRRRAVFVIVAEHKFKDESHVAIQLLGYVAALLKRMNANKDLFADENGRLPAPYPILFSQDNRPKNPPPYLRDILWNIDGLEEFVPFFKYQTIYASDISLETIKSCEPIMRTFLHLTQISNKKHTPTEDAELAETFRLLLEEPESDERARQCVIASLNYFERLSRRRPGMMTLPGLREEIEKQKGEPMEKSGFYLFFGEEIEKKLSERYEKESLERCEKAREDCIYDTIYRNLRVKYAGKRVSKKLREKIDAINYYPALEDVQDSILTAPTLAAFEQNVDEITKRYATEIEEIHRQKTDK